MRVKPLQNVNDIIVFFYIYYFSSFFFFHRYYDYKYSSMCTYVVRVFVFARVCVVYSLLLYLQCVFCRCKFIDTRSLLCTLQRCFLFFYCFYK